MENIDWEGLDCFKLLHTTSKSHNSNYINVTDICKGLINKINII
jgi:hypothetical protein